MENIRSYNELISKIDQKARAYLLLYKEGSELSECALKNLAGAEPETGNNFTWYAANVAAVRDIHEKYGITSAPALLIFENGNFINAVKGCQDSSYYKSLAENAVYQAKMKASGKTQKTVRVYSTPTCTWCNTLKSFLRKNGVPFTDIDVSRDEKAAADMVRRSGQQGVPQTEINGQIVVGFNQPRLKELLEI